MSTRILGSILLLAGLVISFNAQTAPPDLSGTYTGTFDCAAVGLTGDTTLTITGNQFTTAEGKTGRIVASNSGGYMAVALQVGDATTAGTTPQIVSLRARKSGNRLTLTPVAGSMQKCTFMPSRTMARGRKNPRTTPTATGTEVSNPAATTTPATPATPATPMPETPVPSQTPAPSPSPSPSPEASPEPNPSPMPSPTPGGSPNPMPSPTASPSPGASPTPSPTPSPAPARIRG